MFANKNRGFTLIELLVVIAIIGILSSIVLVSLNSARQKGRDARRVGDLKQIQLAAGLYYNDESSYPPTLGDLVDGYLPTAPVDPSTKVQYLYVASTTAHSYVLAAELENYNTALDSDNDTVADPNADFDCNASDSIDTEAPYIYCVTP